MDLAHAVVPLWIKIMQQVRIVSFTYHKNIQHRHSIS